MLSENVPGTSAERGTSGCVLISKEITDSLFNSPLVISAHTVSVPSSSFTAYDTCSRPISRPEEEGLYSRVGEMEHCTCIIELGSCNIVVCTCMRLLYMYNVYMCMCIYFGQIQKPLAPVIINIIIYMYTGKIHSDTQSQKVCIIHVHVHVYLQLCTLTAGVYDSDGG